MEGESAHPVRLRTAFTLTRSSPFAYQCRACSRCCRGKIIPINPYEVARVAQTLGTTTTEVLARFTGTGGSTLAIREDQILVAITQHPTLRGQPKKHGTTAKEWLEVCAK